MLVRDSCGNLINLIRSSTTRDRDYYKQLLKIKNIVIHSKAPCVQDIIINTINK